MEQAFEEGEEGGSVDKAVVLFELAFEVDSNKLE